MSRFIQQDLHPKPVKDTKPAPKFGGKDGRKDYGTLTDAKKIISPNGGRR